MSVKGTCRACHKIGWIRGENRICQSCRYPIGVCAACQRPRRIFRQGLCNGCRQHQEISKEIEELESNFRGKSKYNEDLFRLYLTYIRRYRLYNHHGGQAEALATILKTDSWPAIKNWQDILTLSSRYQLSHPNTRGTGCAVKKIGRMLVELGVLLPRDDDYSAYIAEKLDSFSALLRPHVKDLADWLHKSNRRPVTIFINLTNLHQYFVWMSKVYPNSDPLRVSEVRIVEYIGYLAEKGLGGRGRQAMLYYLRRFFARLCYRKQLNENPCAKIEAPKIPTKINIVSDSDFRGLIDYIKDENSPPREAMIIMLMLLFGLTTPDAIGATLSITDTGFDIVLARIPRSCGRHFYNREQILKLPNSPIWLKDLKERFLKQWQTEYAKAKISNPIPRLMLSAKHHNRQVYCQTAVLEICAATLRATGKKIPPQILKQTCGHLHTQGGDTSVLTILGWSPQSAATYAWRPRKVITVKDNSSPT